VGGEGERTRMPQDPEDIAREHNLWHQVLEYFDASIIGLTATPNKQTFGFFNQNLVMEYGHEQAVADGVNVNYDVYRI
jgi:type I restriction enzyme R subunit